jgi:hypothetical protein
MIELWQWLKFMTPKFDSTNIKSQPEFIAAVENYVLRTRDFYDARARWHRRFYRLSTVLIILVGAWLPLGAGLDYSHKDVVLGISGVAVAALTALRSFYHWDQFWVLNRNTEMLITRSYLVWKASNINQLEPGDNMAIEERNKAALELVDYIVRIRESEAGSFFKVLSDNQGTLCAHLRPGVGDDNYRPMQAGRVQLGWIISGVMPAAERCVRRTDFACRIVVPGTRLTITPRAMPRIAGYAPACACACWLSPALTPAPSSITRWSPW